MSRGVEMANASFDWARRALTFVVCLSAISAVLAQGADTSAEFVSLSASEDVAGEDWFALAVRAREAGDYPTAERALDMASTELAPQRISLEQARLDADRGLRYAAIGILSRLLDNGFTSVRLITGDADLSALAGRPDFDTLVDAMTNAAFPCLADPVFHEFDFWLGTWAVHTPDGQYAGTNTITREESGCVISERWTGAGGSTGSSINFVDKATGEWVQVWNSENGTQISLRGTMTESGMVLSGRIHYVGSGLNAPLRGLWTPLEDGRVRQYFEQSSDEGETWAPWFEGFYTREQGTE